MPVAALGHRPVVLGRCGLPAHAADFVGRLMPLLVIVAASLLVARFDLDRRHGVAGVGAIAQGLASFVWFVPGLSTLKLLTLPALILALIGMVQNITMAQALAIRRRERIDANRELVGLGVANIIAAFYGGMPVGGGLSRSAVNVAAGAQSPLASIVAALSMIDVKAFRQAWSYDRGDALALLGTALGVLAPGLELGIAVGIGLSLATLLLRASTPHIAVIERGAGSEHFRNVERYGVETIPGVVLLRIDESLFFGNLAAVEARLTAQLEKASGTHDLVLIMSGVNRVDTTAMEVLTDINRDLADRGVRLHLAEVKGPVQDRLIRSPLWTALSGNVHLSANSAFEASSRASQRLSGSFRAVRRESTLAEEVFLSRRRCATDLGVGAGRSFYALPPARRPARRRRGLGR